jgi:isoamylase
VAAFAPEQRYWISGGFLDSFAASVRRHHLVPVQRMTPLPENIVAEGTPFPLGAQWIAEQEAYNFALHSRHATAVTLLLFGERGAHRPLQEVPLRHPGHKSGRIWHCRIPAHAVRKARYYAFRVDGPRDVPGFWFDPEKVLLDPYSRGVFFPPRFSRRAAIGPGSNAGQAPLGILPRRGAQSVLPPFDWGADHRPRHGTDLVVYELHLRGFTRHRSSGVSDAARGTCRGVIEKIPYLQELGVNAVELLPVFQFDPQEGNYWGYMPINLFSVHQAYAGAGTPAAAFDEFREMVRALHEAEIEVILDVVYNHTGEAGPDGPLYSFRGIDNSTYYLLTPDLREYRNDSGTGNVLRCAHPAVRELVLDSLRFWVREMHVDGFRFDLASIFTRNSDGSLNLSDPPIISAITSDPELRGIRLIAEAWDIGTYQLGRSFPGDNWLQWNGRFRDDVRSFVRGDPGMVSHLMTRLYGSDDLFPDTLKEAYRPFQSVNFVTAHDGFTLHDLLAYDRKHNEANGHRNTDGTDDNRSWNHGWEGEEGAPREVVATRVRQAKNVCALLMLANGTPMVLAGDEFLQTQRGNNNPYNQDNEITWLDWDRRGRYGEVLRFFRAMLAFRKAHPGISRSRFWRGDIRWHGATPDARGFPDLSWHSHTLAYCLRSRTLQDDDLYVMLNASSVSVVFTVHEARPGEWRRAVDTAQPSPADLLEPGKEPVVRGRTYQVQPRSVVVLLRRRELAPLED